MIEKIIRIRNVGKFADYSAFGDVTMKRLTLIYAENARGKTTLTAILRSLNTGDGRFVNERKTLGSEGSPSIELRLSGSTVTFSSGGWNATCSDMAIFDPVFVTQNVYSGDEIAHEQRRNLHRFYLGDEAGELATRLDEIAESIRSKNANLNKDRGEIQKHIQGLMNVDDFINLKPVKDVDEAITEKEKELETLKKIYEIRQRTTLSTVTLPDVPFGEITPLLATTLLGISEEAEQRTKEHIAACCMDDQGEAWIGQGMQYIQNDRCPFCGQSVAGLALIEAYIDYFSKAYNDLKRLVGSLSERVAELMSDEVLLDIQTTITTNQALAEFWMQHVQAEVPAIDSGDVRNRWTTLRQEVKRLLDSKSSAPLEQILLDGAFDTARAEYERTKAALNEHNTLIQELNGLIAEKKKSLEAVDAQQAENDLMRLKNTKTRFSEEVVAFCDSYSVLQGEKGALEQEKEDKKLKLQEQTQHTLRQYQDRINQYLQRLGADFEIVGATEQHYGGVPRIQYYLSIRGQEVNLEADDSSAAPSFKNTLSSGDKTTLALTFFLARLEADIGIDNKVIVFDDPLSSLDGNRRFQTRQELLRLASQAKQVIVLSHDPYFLRMLWEGISNNNEVEVKTLKITRRDVDSAIETCDIEQETRGEYFRNYCALIEYQEREPSGDLRDVVRCIRPLLEGNLRFRFPGQFRPNYSFRDIILTIQQSQEGSPLEPLKAYLHELQDINEYTRRYHHAENPGANGEAINDTELQGYVDRALSVLGGVYSTGQP